MNKERLSKRDLATAVMTAIIAGFGIATIASSLVARYLVKRDLEKAIAAMCLVVDDVESPPQ